MQYNVLAPTRSLYIHWPFCPYKCHFCPFVALAGHDHFMERYHYALKKEIMQFATACGRRLPIDTLYFGGGTPSTYPNHLLLDMLGILNEAFVLHATTEVTIEVNPGTVNSEQLRLWKEIGINRLSIGVQSLKDSVLKNLNRHQSQEDVYFVIENASKHFENLSIDLIIGLPGVSDDEWKQMLQSIVLLPLKHMSVYFLTVHEDTALYTRVKKKTVTLPCDDGLLDLFHWTIAFLAEHGFEQYEISNYARPGFQSRHNTMYWERKPYKAFGIGACSFDGNVRFANDKNLMRYMEALERTEPVQQIIDAISTQQAFIEKMMLGIRRSTGIALDTVIDDLNVEQQQQLQTKIKELKDGGFIHEQNGQVVLTPRGLSVENEIALQLTL